MRTVSEYIQECKKRSEWQITSSMKLAYDTVAGRLARHVNTFTAMDDLRNYTKDLLQDNYLYLQIAIADILLTYEKDILFEITAKFIHNITESSEIVYTHLRLNEENQQLLHVAQCLVKERKEHV